MPTIQEMFTAFLDPEGLKNLPPGNQSLDANKGNALQFLLDWNSEPDKQFTEMMHEAILYGFFVYLGNKTIQITQLGYLFLTPRSKGN